MFFPNEYIFVKEILNVIVVVIHVPQIKLSLTGSCLPDNLLLHRKGYIPRLSASNRGHRLHRQTEIHLNPLTCLLVAFFLAIWDTE